MLNIPPASSILVFMAPIALLRAAKPSVLSSVCVVTTYNGGAIKFIWKTKHKTNCYHIYPKYRNTSLTKLVLKCEQVHFTDCGLRGYKTLSYSTQPSMKFVLLINLKLLIIQHIDLQ